MPCIRDGQIAATLIGPVVTVFFYLEAGFRRLKDGRTRGGRLPCSQDALQAVGYGVEESRSIACEVFHASFTS